MDDELIKALRMVVNDLGKCLKEKDDWGHIGHSFGRDEFKKLMEFEAEILMAIANNT